MKSFERDQVAMAGLVMKLRALGVVDQRVLSAMERVPRRLFVSSHHQDLAYLDRQVPIECGQSISAPSTMATMLGALGLEPGHRVLEIGCGSGYQAAVLSVIGARVVTLDRYRTLIELAEDRFQALKVEGITALTADGLEGFTRHAPYDRIIVDGAVAKVPGAVMDQLADGGVLVAPVGSGPSQALTRISRDGRLFHRSEIGQVRFVALTEGIARRL